jgi:transcription-repair coupling factor (superfamily II helicase)
VIDVSALLGHKGITVASGAPEGVDALLIAETARTKRGSTLCVVMKDDGGTAKMAELLGFFAPDIDVLDFPAWDCVPYDRVSPNVDVVAKRIDTLTKLVAAPVAGKPSRVVITSIAAILQRVAPRKMFEGTSLSARVGATIPGDKILAFLTGNGYSRTDTVMEPGEFALRGGIIDLFPPGEAEPLRLDFFGDELEAIRSFDPMTQRTTAKMEAITLAPVAEVLLDDGSISRFRTGYRELFGVPSSADPLYEAISTGVRFNGMEHWLPLFHDGVDTLFAFLADDTPLIFDYQVEDAAEARWSLILEYFEARRSVEAGGGSGGSRGESGMVYHPLAPTALYLDKEEWRRLCATRRIIQLSPFQVPDGEGVFQVGGLGGRDFADVRSLAGSNVYDALKTHMEELAQAGMRVVLASWTAGSRERMANVLADHGVTRLNQTDDWTDTPPDPKTTDLVVLSLEHGFRWGNLALVTEQDVLGDRMARPVRKKKRGAQFLAEAASLAEGDLVVHVEHGIGRYDGLETLQIAGAAHDCLRVLYDGNDKLFVPVENLDVLSRFGSDQMGVHLDKLGGAAWQSRKARLKKRIQDMAAQLIAVAAERQVRKGEALTPPEGAWDEFCARFPFAETEDQLRAIEDTVADLASGKPMDRLICGDVGFGKTEVALRTAFVAAMAGVQVAVVVPTTLLARQHYRTFMQRFEGLPVKIGQLSRLVTGKAAAEVKAGMADGSLDIVVGPHAVLAKGLNFKRLGLLIVDEEQHFGVAHKERLKQMKADVHVLTLTATPIPRTLQLALTGVKEMSVIATPPVDRTAVRTFVLPYDPVVLREAILRERYRGGQVFYVCPRLADIDRVAERLQTLVPEVTYAIAHGRLTPTELEDVMNAFGERRYDVLLSTNIVESGLDMPSVNTLIIHRADMFGLGQLYQLRGRVGRSKIRGYAYLTLPNDRVLSEAAQKRLHVMQSLDSLGAGFQLASHDLDIRGAGNLLGDEQSGHIREVGIELYQTLLEEAVAAAKGGEGGVVQSEWSPQIAIGTPVLIPEDYVKDLGLRLSLYRRIADLDDKDDIDALRAEMVDRFGKLPDEVKNLLQVIVIKAMCKKANVAKLDAGPKGAVLTFRDNHYPNPAGLVGYIAQQTGTLKLRPDHKLVMIRNWEDPKIRVDGVTRLAQTLADLA